MSAAEAAVPGMETMEDLQALGFTGFRTVGFLRDEAAVSVPAEPGVWLVMRDATGVPHFLARSTAAHWRGRDPSARACCTSPPRRDPACGPCCSSA